MKRYRVGISFTLPIRASVPHESLFVLDWSSLGDGIPTPNRYIFDVDDMLEVPESIDDHLLHRRCNRCDCSILQPRPAVLEEVATRGHLELDETEH